MLIWEIGAQIIRGINGRFFGFVFDRIGTIQRGNRERERERERERRKKRSNIIMIDSMGQPHLVSALGFRLTRLIELALGQIIPIMTSNISSFSLDLTQLLEVNNKIKAIHCRLSKRISVAGLAWSRDLSYRPLILQRGRYGRPPEI